MEYDALISRNIFFLNIILLYVQDTAELFFDDVRMPSSSLLGEVNHGFYYLMNELPQVCKNTFLNK